MSVSLEHQEEQRARIREGLKTNESLHSKLWYPQFLTNLTECQLPGIISTSSVPIPILNPYFLGQEIGESFCRKTEQRPLDSAICGVPPVKRLAQVTL